jgi:dTMP kinase
MARARKRGALDRFEQEQDAFFERVRRVYLSRARREPRRILRVDAGQDIPSVQRDLAAILDEHLERWA